MKEIKILLLFTILLYLGCQHIVDSVLNNEEIVELKILAKDNTFERVYLKALGNESIIAISNNKDISDIINKSDENIIFEDGDAIFYKVYSDTLEIAYLKGCRKFSILSFNIKIHEKALNNPEFMNVYDEYYKLGYSKFPD